MTKKEREHLNRVAELGCIICGSPAEIHHITGAGMGRRASHFETIPLCPMHHRTGNHGEAVHAGVKAWEENHGAQRELLQIVNKLLNI